MQIVIADVGDQLMGYPGGSRQKSALTELVFGVRIAGNPKYDDLAEAIFEEALCKKKTTQDVVATQETRVMSNRSKDICDLAAGKSRKIVQDIVQSEICKVCEWFNAEPR